MLMRRIFTDVHLKGPTFNTTAKNVLIKGESNNLNINAEDAASMQQPAVSL